MPLSVHIVPDRRLLARIPFRVILAFFQQPNDAGRPTHDDDGPRPLIAGEQEREEPERDSRDKTGDQVSSRSWSSLLHACQASRSETFQSA
jgi:hypothetical protein